MGLEREGIKSSEDFSENISCGTEILPYARFGGDVFLVAGEDDGTVLFVEKVEGIVEVVEIVEAENIVVPGEHVVECNTEGEVVEEKVVEEEVVEEVIEKEVGMLAAVGLVEEEAFGERDWKGLPRDPQGRVALNTFSWRFLLCCFFSSSDWLLSPSESLTLLGWWELVWLELVWFLLSFWP